MPAHAWGEGQGGKPGAQDRKERKRTVLSSNCLKRIRVGLLVTNTHYSEDRHGHPANMVQVLPHQGRETAAPVLPLHFHTHSRLYQLKTTLFGFLVPFRQPLQINQSWQVRENPCVILSKSPQGTSFLGIL